MKFEEFWNQYLENDNQSTDGGLRKSDMPFHSTTRVNLDESQRFKQYRGIAEEIHGENIPKIFQYLETVKYHPGGISAKADIELKKYFQDAWDDFGGEHLTPKALELVFAYFASLGSSKRAIMAVQSLLRANHVDIQSTGVVTSQFINAFNDWMPEITQVDSPTEPNTD